MKSPVLVLAALASVALADQRGDTPGTQPSTPEEQLAKFHVPPGFEVQLVAAEPEIQKPINLNFDAAGRLWVTGSELYPWPASTDANGEPIPGFAEGWKGLVDSFKVGEKAPQPATVGRDSVRILSDFGPDGRARKVTLFADRLNIPSGIQPLPRKPGGWSHPQITQISADEGSSAPSLSPNLRKSAQSADKPSPTSAEVLGDSAIVYSIPNIWLISDPDGDGFAQQREPLYTGFGYTDTHGGSSSYIYWIDGWIYSTHGFRNHSEVRDRTGRVTIVDSGNTCRFRPDGSAFEVFAHGQTNPFGLTFDPLGNLFSADSHSKPVYMLLRGGYYEGIGKQHDGLGFAPRITDDDHGSSSIAGITYYADDKWPAEYRGNLFNGNPVTQRINRDRLEWHGSTPKAIRMPDFLTCDDPWFRPVCLKLGPDGALYIADFYNPIIGHYEVPLTHPSRDHTHGRIWRIVWRGGKEDSAGATDSAPGSTGRRPVALGGPPSAPGVEETSPLQPSASPRPDVSGGPPETTGQRPVLPVAQPPDLTRLDAVGLVEKLADPSLEVRRLATNELVERVERERAVKAVVHWANGVSRIAPNDTESKMAAEVETQASHVIWISARLHDAHGELESSNAVAPLLDGSLSRSAVCSAHEVSLEMERHIKEETAGWVAFIHTEDLLDDSSPRLHRNRASLVSVGVKDLLKRFHGFGQLEMLKAPALENIANSLKPLLTCWDYTPPDDTELIHSVRMALRDCLLVPGAYAKANEYAAINPNAAEHLADVSLGAPTPDSADFLLTHLARTNLETPRAGEYLKHAILHLPAEKLDAVVKLLTDGRAEARPSDLGLAANLMDAARQRALTLPEELTAWAQAAMLAALASTDPKLARQAVDAVRDEKLDAKLEPLTQIIRDDARPEPLRVAALESVANLPASRELLAATLADPRHFKLRKRASELLVAGGTAEILDALPTAPFELGQSMAGDLIENGDAACAQLLDLIEAGKASPRLLRHRLIEIILGQRTAALQARAATLTRDLPPEDERLDKLIAERAKDFAKAKPDATRGAEVFQQNCAVCHRFRNEGGNVGPNLDGVIARGPARLIEDILDPNRNVDPGFRQTIIETHDGQMLAGANVREQGEAVLLTDATGKELTVAKTAIKTRTETPLSLMPPAFESQLAPADFNALLTFLLAPNP